MSRQQAGFILLREAGVKEAICVLGPVSQLVDFCINLTVKTFVSYQLRAFRFREKQFHLIYAD